MFITLLFLFPFWYRDEGRVWYKCLDTDFVLMTHLQASPKACLR